ncbi:MAG: hypothetical protein ACLFTK_16430 [Anaerolineales bacterium]
MPLKRMILHKHGVGFFLHEGPHDGPNLRLIFRAEEINDILKSLTVIDRAEGERVLGMSYPTPMDEAERLKGARFQPSDNATLRELLLGLRGRRVSVTVQGENGDSEAVIGRVVGLDDAVDAASLMFNQILNADDDGPLAPPSLVTLRTTDGALRILKLEDVRGIILQEDDTAQELLYLLDTLAGDEAHRVITVRLSAGAHDLRVGYVAPSPVWRVSYRVVAEANAERSGGVCLLQGWGLFDNRLGQDLQDVQVTFVAGQPISFIYDLASSVIPERPVVRDAARIAPGPIKYEDAAPARSRARRASVTESGAAHKMIDRRPDFEETDYSPAPMADAEASMAVDTMTEARGEFFQYDVSEPVSVRRGESALVPILSRTMTYSRELLYNGYKLPDHPVAALRLKNTTGLTLEQGPVTLTEDDAYLGEAVIPYTRPGETVYMPYAVELGVKVTETHATHVQTYGLYLKEQLLLQEVYHVRTSRFMVHNKTDKALVITIEMPITPDFELFDTREPHSQTNTERRWEVEFPAGERSEFVVKQRHAMQEKFYIRKLNYRQLETFYEGGWLPGPLYADLQAILDKMADAEAVAQARAELDGQREKLYAKQGNLRENLSALTNTADAADLRARLLHNLSGLQDQLDDLDDQERGYDERARRLHNDIEAMIVALGQPQGPPPEDSTPVPPQA